MRMAKIETDCEKVNLKNLGPKSVFKFESVQSEASGK